MPLRDKHRSRSSQPRVGRVQVIEEPVEVVSQPPAREYIEMWQESRVSRAIENRESFLRRFERGVRRQQEAEERTEAPSTSDTALALHIGPEDVIHDEDSLLRSPEEPSATVAGVLDAAGHDNPAAGTPTATPAEGASGAAPLGPNPGSARQEGADAGLPQGGGNEHAGQKVGGNTDPPSSGEREPKAEGQALPVRVVPSAQVVTTEQERLQQEAEGGANLSWAEQVDMEIPLEPRKPTDGTVPLSTLLDNEARDARKFCEDEEKQAREEALRSMNDGRRRPNQGFKHSPTAIVTPRPSIQDRLQRPVEPMGGASTPSSSSTTSRPRDLAGAPHYAGPCPPPPQYLAERREQERREQEAASRKKKYNAVNRHLHKDDYVGPNDGGERLDQTTPPRDCRQILDARRNAGRPARSGWLLSQPEPRWDIPLAEDWRTYQPAPPLPQLSALRATGELNVAGSQGAATAPAQSGERHTPAQLSPAAGARRRQGAGRLRDHAPVFGTQFGGLQRIEVDPTVDPPFGSCFNCWSRRHQRVRCPEPERKHCFNCGRRNETVSSCPRCSAGFREWRARKREEILARGGTPRRGPPTPAGARERAPQAPTATREDQRPTLPPPQAPPVTSPPAPLRRPRLDSPTSASRVGVEAATRTAEGGGAGVPPQIEGSLQDLNARERRKAKRRLQRKAQIMQANRERVTRPREDDEPTGVSPARQRRRLESENEERTEAASSRSRSRSTDRQPRDAPMTNAEQLRLLDRITSQVHNLSPESQRAVIQKALSLLPP